MPPTSGTPPGQAQPKLLIQMSGAPGSGKSTMARLLRKSLSGVVIDHDVLRSALLEVEEGESEREDETAAFQRAAKGAYNLQWALARDMIEQGHGAVIVDSTCNFAEVVDRGRGLADEYGFAYWYVECRVEDVDRLDERLRARRPMRSQRAGVDSAPAGGGHAGEDGRALFRRWIERPCRPGRNEIMVDSTGDVEGNRDRVLEQMLRGNDVEG